MSVSILQVVPKPEQLTPAQAAAVFQLRSSLARTPAHYNDRRQLGHLPTLDIYDRSH